MPSPGRRLWQALRPTPWLVLAGCVLLTCAATAFLARLAHERDAARFRQEVERVRGRIDARLQLSGALLHGARGLFDIAPIGPDAFARYVEALDLPHRHPGLRGLGYSLPHEILYLEPRDSQNEAALGWDMSSEPVRKRAMDSARDSGVLALSGGVQLRQGDAGGNRRGFLLYLATYQGIGVPPTLEERRATLQGYVYLAMRADDLFHALFAHEPSSQIHFRIYDGEAASSDALLFDSRQIGSPGPQSFGFRAERRIALFGHEWLLQAASTPVFAGFSLQPLVALVAALGGLTSFALFGATRAQAQARVDAERQAEQLHDSLEAKEHSEHLVQLIAEASRELAGSLENPDAMLKRVLRVAVQTFADFGLVEFISAEGARRRVASALRDSSGTEALRRLYSLEANDRAWSPIREVIETGRSILYADFSPGVRAKLPLGASQREALDALDLRSLLIVPLHAGHATTGALALGRFSQHRPFSDRDLEVAEELARRLDSALESARLYEEAQHAISVRDDFLSVASHELKTPLTPLTLKLQSTLRLVKNDESESGRKVREHLEAMDRQVRKLSALVGDLLDVARLNAGQPRLTLETLDITTLTREVVSRFEGQASKAGSPLSFEADGDHVGRWDPMRLEQVVSNLLSNALKYGAGLPIHVSIQGHGGLVRLAVRDQGIGIKPEDQPRIFEKFERAVSDRHYGGLGLGLFITRQIVEALGGTIRVQSEVERGSTFVVELPRGTV